MIIPCILEFGRFNFSLPFKLLTKKNGMKQSLIFKARTHKVQQEAWIIEPRHEKICLWHMRTTKVQIGLHIRAVWSASLLFAAREYNILNRTYNATRKCHISVWTCGVGQSIWDILLNNSQRIFGAQWVTSLQHGSLSSNLIGQNGLLGPRRLPTGLKLFNIHYSSFRPIWWGMSLENPLP